MPLTYVTITGTFDDGSGTPLTGTVTFTPSQAVYASGIPLVTPGAPVAAKITNGSLVNNAGSPLTLLATDNAGLATESSTGFWFWTVGFGVPGMQPFSFFLPSSPSTVDLLKLANTGTTGASGGTVTNVSVVSVNGFAGTVANATTTPAISMQTSITGLLKGNGTAVSAASVTDLPDQAWQFRPETYGAKRDGKFLYDAHMTGTTAVLTTAGLPAPSAPSLSNSGSGGSLTAGTYQVKITYVNQFGETLPSSATSQAITGTQPLTISSPAPWTNATAYYAYVTQAGGSTFTRQQSPGSPTPLRTSLVLTANPSSGGANPPGASTSNSAPFTAGDVGKTIVVPSAGGFTNVPLVTTIASFQSATQVTLTAASTSAVNGSGAVYGTDDTAAIQSAVNAAVAYAQAAGNEQADVDVVFTAGIYCVAGAPGGTNMNAQIQLPAVNPYAGPKVNLALKGPQQATGFIHWEQPNPPAGGAVIASMYYADSGTPLTPNQAVIGGPVTGYGSNGGLFSNMRLVVDGINILTTYRVSINGLDLTGVGQADIRSFSCLAMARTSTAAGGWPPYITGGAGNPSPWHTAGYTAPITGNNAFSHAGAVVVYGPYYGVLFTDHFHGEVIGAIYCQYAAGTNALGSAHHCYIGTLISEACVAPLTAATTVDQAVFIAAMQAENANNYVDDINNHIYGEIHVEQEGNSGLIAAGKNGAANVRLIYSMTPLGSIAAPSVPASTTAFVNSFWQNAFVRVTGGTVSAIAIDGNATGVTSGTFFLRTGGTITLTYSAAPTWTWSIG